MFFSIVYVSTIVCSGVICWLVWVLFVGYRYVYKSTTGPLCFKVLYIVYVSILYK